MPASRTLRAPGSSSPAAEVLGWMARGILILISAFWLLFSIMDGIGDAKNLGAMGFIMMLPAALICLAALYIVLRWEHAGAYVLLAVSFLGLCIALNNAMQSGLPTEDVPRELGFQLVLMVLPFLAASVLLFIKHGLEHKQQ